MKPFNEVKNLIESYGGIAFGSRAWSTNYTDNSDYDYVMDFNSQLKVKQILLDDDCTCIVNSDYYLNSYYIRTIGGMFNIVTYKARDLEAWIGAIRMMQHSPAYINNVKNNRQMVFETLLALFKKLR